MNDPTCSTPSKRLITKTTGLAVLRPLFVSLPTPKDTDQESLIAGYFVALEGLSLEAFQNVVMKIVKGMIGDIKFCPRPPELASMVRKEEASIDLMREPKNQHTAVQKPTMRAYMEKRWKGKKVLATNVENDKFKSREWPPGSVYVPILSTVFAADPNRYATRKGPTPDEIRIKLASQAITF